jgi:hypothetical protein
MTTSTVRCTQPGCGGTIQDGYCDTCRPAAPAASSPGSSGSSASSSRSTRTRALARLTPAEARRVELVDMANAIRPRTLT